MTQLRAPCVTSVSEHTHRLVWVLPSGPFVAHFVQLLKEEVSYSLLKAFLSDDEEGDVVVLEYPENQSNQVVFVVYLMNQLHCQQQLARRCWESC